MPKMKPGQRFRRIVRQIIETNKGQDFVGIL
jgi:hypothetical protein